MFYCPLHHPTHLHVTCTSMFLSTILHCFVIHKHFYHHHLSPISNVKFWFLFFLVSRFVHPFFQVKGLKRKGFHLLPSKSFISCFIPHFVGLQFYFFLRQPSLFQGYFTPLCTKLGSL